MQAYAIPGDVYVLAHYDRLLSALIETKAGRVIENEGVEYKSDMPVRIARSEEPVHRILLDAPSDGRRRAAEGIIAYVDSGDLDDKAETTKYLIKSDGHVKRFRNLAEEDPRMTYRIEPEELVAFEAMLMGADPDPFHLTQSKPAS